MGLFRTLYKPKTTHWLDGKEGWIAEEETTLRSRGLREGRYVFASRFVFGKRVLELGCGSGAGAVRLEREGASAVVATDRDYDALLYVRRRYPDSGLALVCLDAEDLPFGDSSFDVVVAMELIEHLSRPERFLAECSRVLESGGIIICSTPNKAVSSPNTGEVSFSSHTREFYPAELRGMMLDHFGQVSLFGYYSFTLRRRILEMAIALGGRLVSSSPFLKGWAVRLVNRLFFRNDSKHVETNRGPQYEVLPFDEKLNPYTLVALGRADKTCR